MIRDDIKAALVSAMKGGDKAAHRRDPPDPVGAQEPRHRASRRRRRQPDDDVLVTEVLQKMIKQRRESIDMYEQGGRQELADAESGRGGGDRGLPAPPDERRGGQGRDRRDRRRDRRRVGQGHGRVMALLKERHAGELDMSKASGLVKARLSR